VNIVQVSSGQVRIPVEKGGAVEEFTVALSRCLSQMGQNVTILDRKYSNDDPNVDHINGVKIVRLKAMKFNFSVLKKLPKLSGFFSKVEEFLNYISFSSSVNRYLSKARDMDVIHSHFSVIALSLAAANKHLRAKSVYTCHTALRLINKPSVWERLTLIPENLAVRLVGKVIVDNELTKGKLVKAAKIKPEKVSVLPYGVDVGVFNPAADIGDIKNRYGLDKGTIVLFVGRIAKHKGVEYLVKAAHIVVNETGHKDIQFVLAGPGGFREGMENSPYYNKVLGLIEEYGLQQNLKLTGRISLDDLIRLYRAADMFVLPSVAEMAPTVIREAMACAKPVIGTKVGNIPELITDGLNGFLVEPGSEKQLARKIIYLADNPAEAKKLGINGRKVIEERSWEKTAEKLLLVYEAD
jgi:glycosyltransferase involved in cell wall biosynthesis